MATKTKWNEDFLAGLQRKQTNRVVLLYSSGLDSTATALVLKEQGYDVFPLFVYYGQTSGEAESKLVNEGAARIGLNPVQTIDISNILDLCSGKLTGGVSISDSDAWLPARNTLFLVLAGMYAQTIDADAISIGYGLHGNFVYADNMLVHHQLLEIALTFSLVRELKVLLPIKHLDKRQILEIVKDRGLLDLSISCWNAKLRDGQVIPCGECVNCIEKNTALEQMEVKDGLEGLT